MGVMRREAVEDTAEKLFQRKWSLGEKCRPAWLCEIFRLNRCSLGGTVLVRLRSTEVVA